jgi:hypothetical protein
MNSIYLKCLPRPCFHSLERKKKITMNHACSTLLSALVLSAAGGGCAMNRDPSSELDPERTMEARAPVDSARLIDVDTSGCETNVAINNAIGQSFQVSSPTHLDRFEIWIKPELYYTTSYNVEVYDGEGTGGAKLATSEIVTMGSQTDGAASTWYSFGFAASDLSLQANHAYTFQLVRLSQYSGAFSQCGDVYPGGMEYWLGQTAFIENDMSFRLYGDALPHRCADIKAGGATADGEYVIHVEGHPVSVYCEGMTDAPAEYLTLVNTESGANTSYYGAGPKTAPNGVTTSFARVRFYPSDLTVDGTDTTFSTSQGWKSLGPSHYTTNNFGEAGDCAGDRSETGTANIDLRGTPFAVAPDQFSAQGSTPAGTATYSANNQVVDLTGGGHCGNMAVEAGTRIKLQWAPSAGALPHGCADVKAGGATADGEYVIHVDGHPVSVYCKELTGTPAEYLTLVTTESRANTSYYGAGPNTAPNGVTTSFARVRFYPSDLTVDGTDTTFSTSQGWKSFGPSYYDTNNFGDAGDCAGDNSKTGTANIDLRGTPFAVAPDQFSAQGSTPAGTATYSANNQVVDLTGGGNCGNMAVEAGTRIKLQWAPSAGALPHGCADIESDGECVASCQSIDDCVAPRVCDSSNRCVLPRSNEDHSGCHASPAKAAGGEVGWLGALVGAVIAVRARRRGAGRGVGRARRRLDVL